MVNKLGRIGIILLFLELRLFWVGAVYKTVCYYESWGVYRRLDSRLGAEFSLSPPPCTHLIYAFAVIKDGEISSFDPQVDLDGTGQYGGYQKFNQINQGSRGVKTLLAVGGWNAGSKEFSDMASSSDTIEAFAQQAITYLRRYGFQGLDLDWEYPADRDGSRPEDKDNLSDLLQELRKSFDAEETQAGQDKLLLSVAISPHPDKLDKSYDMKAIGQYVDLINVMTYDYARASWSAEIKPHNPMYKRPEDTSWQSQLNADWAIQKMIQDGVPPEKLILGVPTYGVTYKVARDGHPVIHGSHQGAGEAGPVTKEKGYLAFYELCRRLKLEKGWISSMDASGVPVCYRKNEWISYENPKSARAKALYVMRNRLGGAMVWSLATDDFNGFCYGKKFPLTQTLRDTFDAGSKLMNRGYSGGMDESEVAVQEKIPQYCVADISKKSAPSTGCTTQVLCPKIKKSYLPYEMSCVQVLGKCSYPKLQICDVPKLVASSMPKFSLYTDSSLKPVNISCRLSVSTTPSAVSDVTVVTVNEKCGKKNYVCEPNQLGGFNIIDYFCPPYSEFDPTLKVCKLSESADPDFDDDSCSETATTPSTKNRYFKGAPPRSSYKNGVYAYGLNEYQLTTTTWPVGPPQQRLVYKGDKNDDGYGQKEPTLNWNTPKEFAAQDNALSATGDDVLSLTTQPPTPEWRVEPVSHKKSAGPRRIVTLPPKRVPMTPVPEIVEDMSSQELQLNSNSASFPKIFVDPDDSPSVNSVVTERTVPPAFLAEKVPEALKQAPPPKRKSPVPTKRFYVRPKENSLGTCGPIGNRVSNPEKPCSSSFLLCLSPSVEIELNCSRGLVYDTLQGICAPKEAVRC